MTISVYGAARTICDLSGWSISHFHLQRILYITSMVYLGRHDGKEPLIREHFEAWDTGPMSPDVHRELKGYGNKVIPKTYTQYFGCLYTQEDLVDTKEAIFLREAWNELSKKSKDEVTGFVFEKNSAWSKVYDHEKIKFPKIISNAAMLEEYKARMKN